MCNFYLILLTNLMQQSPSSEADIRLGDQYVPRPSTSKKTESSLMCLQSPDNGLYAELVPSSPHTHIEYVRSVLLFFLHLCLGLK
jgi:hypothetical protein